MTTHRTDTTSPTQPNGVDYNEIADWLRDHTLKLRSELGDGEHIIKPLLAMIEINRMHAYPSRDTLAANALAQENLRHLAQMHQDEPGFPAEWRTEAVG